MHHVSHFDGSAGTNTLLYYLKGMGHAAQRLLATPPAQVAIPAVVIHELEYGIARSTSPRKRMAQLAALAGAAALLPFDANAAKQAARARVKLEKAGRPIGPLDIMIAGTALAANGTLITHNTKEFSRVPELVIDDWY